MIVDTTGIDIKSVITKWDGYKKLTPELRHIIDIFAKGGPVFYRSSFPQISSFKRLIHFVNFSPKGFDILIRELDRIFGNVSSTTFAAGYLNEYEGEYNGYRHDKTVVSVEIAFADDEKVLLELSDLQWRLNHKKQASDEVYKLIDFNESLAMGYIVEAHR